MIDYNLAVSAIDALLHSMSGASQVERYKAYTSIVGLSREIEQLYKRRGISDHYVNEKFIEMRYHAANSAGLIDDGKSRENHIHWSSSALRSIISSLELLGFEHVHR